VIAGGGPVDQELGIGEVEFLVYLFGPVKPPLFSRFLASYGDATIVVSKSTSSVPVIIT